MTTTAIAPRAPALEMGTLSDPAELGRMLAASGYFSDATDAAQAVVKVLAGAELGFGPIASMTGVYIVKGRVTLSANLMAATIKRHPSYDYRAGEHTDTRAVIAFLDATRVCATCQGTGAVADKRCDACFGGGRDCIGKSEFTMDMAKTANLAGGENWRKYPGNMLWWRAMSNGAKMFCPDAFAGAPIYTPDELGATVEIDDGGDFSGRVIDVPVPSPTTTSTRTADPQAGGTGTTPSAPPASDDRPAGVSENAAPVAPASVGTGPTIGGEDAEAVRQAAADENAGVSEDEHAALAELLDAVNAPESFRSMALMSYGVGDMADLTKMQAREVMGRAMQRFGSKADGAA